MAYFHQSRKATGVAAYAPPARFGAEGLADDAVDEATTVAGATTTTSSRSTVFGYLRRSAEDRRGRPLETQRDTILRYVADFITPRAPRGTADGVREFFIDNGVSGTTDPASRPGMSKLIETVRSTPRAHVVVYDATRVARAVEAGIEFKRILDHAGASLHLAQSRAVVEGSNEEMMFVINLQMAASERVAAITRIRSAFRSHPNWDPRRFGIKFAGAGTTPQIDVEETALIEEMKNLYESKGEKTWTPSEIAKYMQIRTGGHRYRKIRVDHAASAAAGKLIHQPPPEDKQIVPWTAGDVIRIATQNKWVWGGGKTKADLEREIEEARRTNDDVCVESFFAAHKGELYDGVRINRAMLKRYFTDEMVPWRRRALELVCAWSKNDRNSIDDIAAMLQKEIPRAWTRQTVWRLTKQAREIIERENAAARERELAVRFSSFRR